MTDTVLGAVIGAVGAIAAAIITIYPSIKEKLEKSKIINVGAKKPNYKPELKVFFSVIGLAALIVIVAIILSSSGIASDSLEVEAQKAGKPYMIESITALARIKDERKDSTTKRHLYVRTVYVMRMLRNVDTDIQPDDFTEEYFASATKPSPEHWYGSEQEKLLNDNGSRYIVKFKAEEGSIYTVVTGVRYTYSIPLPQKRILPGGVVTLADKQDYYAYRNDLDYEPV